MSDALAPPRAPDLSRAAPWLGALLALALVAFWPSYLSRMLAWGSYTHLHAATAALWMLLLIAQPLAIRARRQALHRALGRTSFVLAPLVILSIVLLAHSRIQGLEGGAYAIQTYILYLQLSLTALFALSYGLAMLTRRRTALHARFMVCTALTLVDPILIRFAFWVDHIPTWNYQWVTFGLTDLALLVLIALERHERPAVRRVFPAMLLVFALAQAPALLGGTESVPWQSFAAWFAALPLT